MKCVAIFGEIVEEYEAIHPNVTIEIRNNPWDGYWTKLPLALQKGEFAIACGATIIPHVSVYVVITYDEIRNLHFV